MCGGEIRINFNATKAMTEHEIRIRKAETADTARLRELIDMSVRALQAEDYSKEQMEGALEAVFGVDSQLVEDGTYFVAEARITAACNWELAGCGGWSKRKTLFGGDAWTGREDSLLDPQTDAAKI